MNMSPSMDHLIPSAVSMGRALTERSTSFTADARSEAGIFLSTLVSLEINFVVLIHPYHSSIASCTSLMASSMF